MYSFYLLLNFCVPSISLLAGYDISNFQYRTIEGLIQDGYSVEYQPNCSVLSALKDLASVQIEIQTLLHYRV